MNDATDAIQPPAEPAPAQNDADRPRLASRLAAAAGLTTLLTALVISALLLRLGDTPGAAWAARIAAAACVATVTAVTLLVLNDRAEPPARSPKTEA